MKTIEEKKKEKKKDGMWNKMTRKELGDMLRNNHRSFIQKDSIKTCHAEQTECHQRNVRHQSRCSPLDSGWLFYMRPSVRINSLRGNMSERKIMPRTKQTHSELPARLPLAFS